MRRFPAFLHRGLGLLALAAAPAVAAEPPPPVEAAPPQRVVSINLCADQMALLLLPRERIIALSHLATDRQLSFLAPAAAGIPQTEGLAEEVLALRPDLVLAGRFTARAAVGLLRARGVPVLELELTDSFDAIRQQTRLVAARLGVSARAEEVLAEMDRTLEAARPMGEERPTALSLAPGGFTAGAGTLTDAVMQAAGLRNLAALNGLKAYGYLSVESVAAHPPDLMLAKPEGGDQAPSLNTALLSHPALARAVPAERRPALPGSLITCGIPSSARAVTILAQARASFLAARLQVATRDSRPGVAQP